MVEELVYGGIALGVAGLLFWQGTVRSRVRKQPVIEAPFRAQGTVGVAALMALALLGAMFTLMLTSLQEWRGAAIAAGVTAVFALAIVHARKPLGVLRLNGTEDTLSWEDSRGVQRIVLGEPFSVDEALWTPTLILPRVYSGQVSVVTTIRQRETAIAWHHPWSLAAVGNTQQVATSRPPIRLDWRGALILERLKERLPSSAALPGPTA